MNWNKIKIFHAVADAGSFTHAGELLSLSQSAVSRQVAALEEDLNVLLFHRHARGLKLTAQGETLFRAAHEMSARIAMTEALLTEAKEKPSGELTISATVGFGSTWLTPRIGEFLEHYPDINVHIVVTDRELDLSMREADVAIRMRLPVQPDLVQRKLMTFHHHVYAAPEYLQRFGTPQRPEDLDHHRLIIYGEEAPSYIANVNWLIAAGTADPASRRPVLRVNNVYGLLLAVESGVGIGAIPDYMVRGNNRITQILPDLEGPQFDTYFVYPEELRDSLRIGIFRDFLIRKVAEWHF
ncbi:MAG: LysR family transcriptional regulator [Alphaproteobacteria bacterium]|jgi:DNA-binding transcriptional LysR family regulator|nr:LysR family transcriptional regulator [Alphaproteobacteria bacterium]MDP6269964.1 LysR family transcriptional regulator [Alphaproteobacteria bacterium]MDP7427390.1 LysR family transcriptional regulator [Alphaproteobacteria bacterium]